MENNILSINNTLNTKANLGGSETQVFNVADPTSDWHAINLAYAKKNFNAGLINTHKTDFNNPHRTSIANLIDTSIVSPVNNHILQYDSNTRKWKNAVLSVDLSNYYNKSEVDSKLQDVLTQADSRYAQLLTKNLKWTVGAGGDFTNLQDALNKASSYTPIRNYFITIMLKSGYNGSLSVSLNNVNLGFVKIDAESDLKNMQFYFDFKNVICPKFNNKIKVKLNAYSSAIYIEDEITLDIGTALEGCTLVILNTLNILCKGTTGYNQDFFFNRCQFKIKNLNMTFSGVENSEMHNGLVLWNSIGRIDTITFKNNINRLFRIIWNIGSNTEIVSLNGTISDQVSVPNCRIIQQDRGGFVSITTSVNITGGGKNITVFAINEGSILFPKETKHEISILLGNCTKSNIASNILSASGGFINR
ncbi:hypothetical protein [Campylobacter phage vB_CcoM-IBB_35]|uniref:Uncharacterized protein n=1 Tax=Campylobacter virus IBB35 TaxID=1006972 RepID=H6SUN3_9CAUD|nr:hypothetical protein FDG52_s5gp13 [Campylobacter phage vB_CcoM-IBB_35]AEI88250.1 hypothetical protein [Campylobacter phage vB_CcoM-IBB_35]